MMLNVFYDVFFVVFFVLIPIAAVCRLWMRPTGPLKIDPRRRRPTLQLHDRRRPNIKRRDR